MFTPENENEERILALPDGVIDHMTSIDILRAKPSSAWSVAPRDPVGEYLQATRNLRHEVSGNQISVEPIEMQPGEEVAPSPEA